MVSAFPLHKYTFQDYLRLEAESSTRHEFLDGEILAMAGGTPEHAALAAAAARQLGNQLDGSKCRVFSPDLRVRVPETGLTTYPDLTIVCGRTVRDPASDTTVTNPRVVLEVTSDSSEDYDRGSKLQQYQTIPSLEAIVVVSHRDRKVEVWSRVQAAWAHAVYGSGQRAVLEPVHAELDVDALYASATEPEG